MNEARKLSLRRKARKITKNFYIYELVPENIYDRFEDGSIRFLDEEAVRMLQFIRDYFGKPFIVNNWIKGGHRQYSGFRPPDCPEGAELSSHKLGKAFDFLPLGVPSQKIIDKILSDNEFFVNGVRAIETGTNGWVHVSAQWTNKSEIVVYKYA